MSVTSKDELKRIASEIAKLTLIILGFPILFTALYAAVYLAWR